MDPYLSIVIPIYNEEENIPVLWKRLAKVMAESFADVNRVRRLRVAIEAVRYSREARAYRGTADRSRCQ